MLKEKVQQVVGKLPEDVDVDALVEKLSLLEKIELGERQLAEGRGRNTNGPSSGWKNGSRDLDA